MMDIEPYRLAKFYFFGVRRRLWKRLRRARRSLRS